MLFKQHLESFINSMCAFFNKNCVNLKLSSLSTKSDANGLFVKLPQIFIGKGDFVYILYDSNGTVLYVGETGSSIYDRVFGHGGGSHQVKDWFAEVWCIKILKIETHHNYLGILINKSQVKYLRRLIESALVVKLTPKYNY